MSFEALRAELSRRKAPEGATVRNERGPRAAHPLADLRRLAAYLNGDTPVATLDDRHDGSSPPLETLTTEAAELGLDVMYATRALRALDPADLPCLALMKDGTSRILMRHEGRDAFTVHTAGQRSVMTRAELEAAYAGAVFLVRRREAPGSAEPSVGPTTGGPVVATVVRLALTRSPGLFVQMMVAAALANLFMLALPLFTMAVYDRVVPHFALETLWALAIGVALVLVLDVSIRFVRLKLVDAVALDTSLSLQARLYRTILRMRMGDAPRTAGGLATHVRELDVICQSVPPIVVAIVVDLPFFIAILALLAVLGGGAIAVVPLIGVVVLVAVSYAAHRAASASQVESAVLARSQANQIIETVGALEWVKATNAESKLLARWERLADDSAFASHRGRLWQGLSHQFGSTVTQFVVVAVVVLGVYQIGAGGMTVGALTAATLLVGRAIAPIVQLIAIIDRLAHLSHVSESLEKLFDAPQESGGDALRGTGRAVAGRFELTRVGFKYPGDAKPTLEDINLLIKPGERVGIIGRVGCGKSTLLRLFLRLHEPTNGAMTLDGHDIRQIAPRTLRAAVGFMRQESVLFDDTLLANVTFGADNVSEAALERAMRLSGVADIAVRHPQGYSLPVGPRGERLSGGERQTIALARALLADPPVLILDEPTAAMDNGLEARIVRDLQQATQGRTVIVATHRAPVLQLCDRIIWLDGGRIVADGPRDEILRRLAA